MELIDKAAVKAIIGRMQDCTMDEDGNFYSSSALAEYNILCDLENRLDTLEVKEVKEPTASDAFIEKACKWLKSKGGFTIGFDGATVRDFLEFINK